MYRITFTILTHALVLSKSLLLEVQLNRSDIALVGAGPGHTNPNIALAFLAQVPLCHGLRRSRKKDNIKIYNM